MEQRLRRREAQLLAAQEIQQQILPDAPPQLLPGFDLAAALHPAEFAAGDFFDYLPMLDGSMGLVVGDVTGHGFGPALLMVSTCSLLRSLVGMHTEVLTILALANSMLVKETREERFVTLFFACLDPRSRRLVHVNAGHPTGYVMNCSGELKARLRTTALPLGVSPDTRFSLGDPLILSPGDLVLLPQTEFSKLDLSRASILASNGPWTSCVPTSESRRGTLSIAFAAQ